MSKQFNSFNDVLVYSHSNEDMRTITSLTHDAQDILTVAGSGDQALYYTVAGASHIDTYDIVPAARGIQELKTAAAMTMKHSEFISFISNFAHPQNMFNPKKRFQLIPQKILNKLTPNGIEAIRNMIFRTSLTPNDAHTLPNFDEFEHLQANLHGHYNFICAPLQHLHKHLTRQYDVINISNIFDHIVPDVSIRNAIMKNLAPFLKVGGRIVYPTQADQTKYENAAYQNQEQDAIVEFESSSCGLFPIIMFRRTR